MAQFPYLPLWTDALIADTTHLSTLEFGAYLKLLIAAWRSPGCRLPNDEKRLAQLSGDPRHWHMIRGNVMEFWHVGEDGHLYQKRLVKEHFAVTVKSEKLSQSNRTKALRMWEKRKPTALQQQSNGIEPIPIPINKDAGREERKWVSVTQPEWKTARERWRKEKGCDPPMDADGGWWFPPDWIEGKHIQ